MPVGGRVAFLSQNSARLLTSFWGVCGYGRVLVPINFRLSKGEVNYIVEHSGAEVVYCDPEQKAIFDQLDVEHKFLLGEDDDLYLRDTEPREWAEPGRGGHRDDQLHVRHDRPTQGRPAHPSQQLAERDGVRAAHRDQRPRRLPAHAADVPRQRVGHAVRDHRGRREAHRPAQGRRRRDPAPHRRARRHRHVRGAGRDRRRARRRRELGRRDPRPRPGADHRRRRPAADPHDRARPRRTGLGVHPDLRPHRDVSARHDQPPARRVGRAVHARAGPQPGPGRRARTRRPDRGRRRRRGAHRVQPQPRRLLGAAGRDRRRAGAATGSTPATAA